MDIRKVNWRNGFLVILFLLSATLARAQTDVLEGKDYSFLNFDSVNHFFHKKDLALVKAVKPDLYFEVYDWLGTPYQAGGRSHQGIDCSDFASYLYEVIYQKMFRGNCAAIYKKCAAISVNQLTEGDFVFFSIRGPVSHVGVYLGNNKFAHATVHGGVMVSDLGETYYKKHFYKAARLIE